MSPLYLLILLALIGCMMLMDRRWKLAFWRDARQSAIIVIVGAGLLLLVDVIAIALGIFARASTWAMTGILLGPELPIEEPFFLVFLVYLTINLLALFGRLPGREKR